MTPCQSMKTKGRDKRAYIAALRQAKIYPPRQAAAAADHGLWKPQCTRRNPQDGSLHVMDCGLCIAAAAMHDLSLSLSLSSIFHFSQYATFLIFRFIYLRQLPSNFAAAIHEVECSSAHGLQLVHCGHRNPRAAESMRWIINSRGLWQLVDCRALMCRNISPFIRSHF